MPNHTHRIPDQLTTDSSGFEAYTWNDYMNLGQNRAKKGSKYWWSIVEYVGGSQAHNNLQPYITTYMWKRTA